MAILSRLIVYCLVIGVPLTAAAQPSFRCSGDLTRTERAICGSQKLAKLDLQMYELYRDKYRSLEERPKRRLKARQGVWLKWRDTCGGGKTCLERRYTQRIADLRPAMQQMQIVGTLATGALTSGGTPSVPADQVVERRIGKSSAGNERYEVVYGDGRIEWRAISGGGFGTDYPDGRKEVYSFNQVVVEGFPALPGGYSEWGERVETDLLGVIDTLLSEADRAEYRTLHGDKNYSVRVQTHIQVIGFLVNN